MNVNDVKVQNEQSVPLTTANEDEAIQIKSLELRQGCHSVGRKLFSHIYYIEFEIYSKRLKRKPFNRNWKANTTNPNQIFY